MWAAAVVGAVAGFMLGSVVGGTLMIGVGWHACRWHILQEIKRLEREESDGKVRLNRLVSGLHRDAWPLGLVFLCPEPL